MLDITTLGLAVDSRQVKQATMDLLGMSSAGDKAASSAGTMESGFSRLGNTLKALALGASVLQVVKLADAMTLADARLRLATGSTEDFVKAQEAVYRISQQTNSGLLENVALFTKLHEPVKRLGGGVRETSAIVESFAASLKVGGASTQEAAAATLQFAQAMGSGKLQGDEFRSIAEASPRFMKALADGMGVPIEQLKKMGSEGKLTADIVGNALTKSLGQLRSELKEIPDTASGAFTRLMNDVKLTVNEINKNSGLTLGIAELLEEVRGLTPVIKTELVGAFMDVNEWIQQNKEGISDAWNVAKALGGDVWELAKAFGSVVGFVLQSGNEAGVFVKTLEYGRLAVAGLRDGFEFIGAVAAKIGALFLQYVVEPLTHAVNLAGIFVGVFDQEAGDKLRTLSASMRDLAKATADSGNAYADSVFAKFADGRTAVQEADAAITKARESSRQMKEALAGGAVAAGDSAREMGVFARQADAASGPLKVLKNSHKELTDEQKKLLDRYGDLERSIWNHVEELDRELDGVGQLNEAEKAAIKFKSDLADKYKGLSKDQVEHINWLLEEWDARIKLQEAAKAEAKVQEDAHQAQMKAWQDAEKIRESYADLVERQEEYNDRLRYTDKELKKVGRARLDEAIAVAKQKVAQDALKPTLDAEAQANRETLDGLLRLAAARDVGIHLEAARETADAWRQVGEDMYSSLTDAAMRAWGKNGEGLKGFIKDIKDQLKRAALSMTVKVILDQSAQWLQGLVALLGGSGTGGSGAGNALSGFIDAAKMGSSAYSGLSSFFTGAGSVSVTSGTSATLGGTVAQSSATKAALLGAEGYGSTAGGVAAAEGGTAAAGASSAWMSAAGYAAIVAIAIAIANNLYEKGYTGSDRINTGASPIAKNAYNYATAEGINVKVLKGLGLSDKWAEIFSGSVRMNWTMDKLGMLKTPHVGGYSYADAEGNVKDITKQQSGIPNATMQEWTNSFAKDVLTLINNTGTKFGAKTKATGVSSIFESDNKDGSWGVLGIEGATGRLSGFEAKGTLPSDPGEGFQKYTDMAAGAIVDALVQIDIPQWVKTSLSDLKTAAGEALTMKDLSTKLSDLIAFQDAMDGVTARFADLGGVFKQMDGLTSDAKFTLVGMVGGLDQLNAVVASYAENFTTTAEKTDTAWRQIDETLSAVGLATPKTREEFAAMVNTLDLTTESGLKAWNAAMSVQNSFAQLTPSLDAVAQASTEAAAANEAHAAAVAQERYGLETRLLQLEGRTQELRARELELLDPANRDLQTRIWELEDQRDAAKSAGAAYSSMADSASSAASTVASAMDSAFKSIVDEVNRLRGIVSQSTGQTLAQLQATFAIDVAAAKSGDAAAAGRLSGLSQKIEEAAKSRAANRQELDFIRASVASSLESVVRGNNGAVSGLVAEIKQMREDVVAQSKRSADASNTTARTLRRATNGNALRTTT